MRPDQPLPAPRGPRSESILLICTGNQCRSPMAAAMLERLLSERRLPAKIESAGFISENAPCPSEVTHVMATLGYDLSRHRSRTVDQSLIDGADLIIGMTRQHLVDLALRAPGAWTRTFTLGEAARLADITEPRRRDESLPAWVTRIGAGRTRAALLALPLSEDVPDPIGKPLNSYVRARDMLRRLCSRLADRMAPV